MNLNLAFNFLIITLIKKVIVLISQMIIFDSGYMCINRKFLFTKFKLS